MKRIYKALIKALGSVGARLDKIFVDTLTVDGQFVQTRLAKFSAFFFSMGLTLYITITTLEEFVRVELCLAWMAFAFGTNWVKKYYENQDKKRINN